ncbi:MAG: pseudouridine synthase [Bryobacteraceae bacterium]|nr:pseudouridine synthase [Bryobacteraceae bacterium]
MAVKRPLKTLERALSKAGLGSRTEARSWIGAGRVAVNGKIIQTPDHWVDLDRDRIEFDGKPLRAAEPVYLLLYKPTGYITTAHDPDGRPTVYDLIRDVETWVSPVGRLDLDTSGLLILTNDNQFADQVMSPENKVPKTYLVKTNSHLTDADLQRLRDGVELSDGPTAPARVTRVRDNASSTFLDVTITEGRNRQVRRMIEAVGRRVRKLVRTAVGPVQIGDLAIGTWRHLTPRELQALGRLKT